MATSGKWEHVLAATILTYLFSPPLVTNKQEERGQQTFHRFCLTIPMWFVDFFCAVG